LAGLEAIYLRSFESFFCHMFRLGILGIPHNLAIRIETKRIES
jgi:hypothetical protein